MKNRLTHLTLAIFTVLVLLSFSDSRPKKSLFNGVWQFASSVSDEGTMRPKLIEMKVFNNGKFDGYLMRPEGSVKTMSGTYKILNDSVYTETLISGRNQVMVGKTYVIKYRLNGNLMTAIGSYDASSSGEVYKVSYNQTWARVD